MLSFDDGAGAAPALKRVDTLCCGGAASRVAFRGPALPHISTKNAWDVDSQERSIDWRPTLRTASEKPQINRIDIIREENFLVTISLKARGGDPEEHLQLPIYVEDTQTIG